MPKRGERSACRDGSGHSAAGCDGGDGRSSTPPPEVELRWSSSLSGTSGGVLARRRAWRFGGALYDVGQGRGSYIERLGRCLYIARGGPLSTLSLASRMLWTTASGRLRQRSRWRLQWNGSYALFSESLMEAPQRLHTTSWGLWTVARGSSRSLRSRSRSDAVTRAFAADLKGGGQIAFGGRYTKGGSRKHVNRAQALFQTETGKC